MAEIVVRNLFPSNPYDELTSPSSLFRISSRTPGFSEASKESLGKRRASSASASQIFGSPGLASSSYSSPSTNSAGWVAGFGVDELDSVSIQSWDLPRSRRPATLASPTVPSAFTAPRASQGCARPRHPSVNLNIRSPYITLALLRG
ncbi:hypothetical protein BDP27DRAFT_1427615 [Rhodocollybia butyracea]|uniref:Uncharacterized protein n=1 Tax=Rhodocollybia butyracea TaxID=206335 RepID=A0A9P5PGD6_9AGAR|nr:hypothetical protein BDP27DRAFT_1427615 [Rhodocollybia butyracea]